MTETKIKRTRAPGAGRKHMLIDLPGNVVTEAVNELIRSGKFRTIADVADAAQSKGYPNFHAAYRGHRKLPAKTFINLMPITGRLVRIIPWGMRPSLMVEI